MIAANRIAAVMGVRKGVKSLQDLSAVIHKGLPKSALPKVVSHVFSVPRDRRVFQVRVIPEATFKRRRSLLKPEESERVERLARVVATAEYVWDDEQDARAFLTSPHPMLGGDTPFAHALTELGAREVEDLLWGLFHGHPA